MIHASFQGYLRNHHCISLYIVCQWQYNVSIDIYLEQNHKKDGRNNPTALKMVEGFMRIKYLLRHIYASYLLGTVIS